MLTEQINGFFDVRRYAPNVEKKNQQIKADNETITFNTFMSEPPECFKAYSKPATTKDGTQIYRVSFKISERCRWFGEDAQPMQRPANTELEQGRWTARIDYRQVDGDPAKMEARGYWANAIMAWPFERVNPFAAFATAPSEQPEHEAAPEQAAGTAAEAEAKLPF